MAHFGGLVTLTTDALEVAILPDYGARVVALVDRRTGRNWLASGRLPTAPDESGVYGVEAAAGWDECFPTVSPCDGAGTPWPGRLRDHGDLWGRPWQVEDLQASAMSAFYAGDGYRFARSLLLEGDRLVASYRLDNDAEATMPFLWSQHALLALRPGERIELPGVAEVEATHVSPQPLTSPPSRVRWPEGDGLAPFALDCVQPTSAQFAAKLYATGGERRARIGGVSEGLDLAWEGVDHVGLWLAYGGWPSPNQILHVAIEPTHAPDDHLQAAMSRGRAAELSPGATACWRVSLRLRAPPPDAGA